MRKFAIILPKQATWRLKVGKPPLVSTWLADAIVSAAGGCTRSDVFGIWRGPNGIVAEGGYRYEFASAHDLTEFIRSTASFLVRETHELCVYVEYGDGAEIIGL